MQQAEIRALSGNGRGGWGEELRRALCAEGDGDNKPEGSEEAAQFAFAVDIGRKEQRVERPHRERPAKRHDAGNEVGGDGEQGKGEAFFDVIHPRARFRQEFAEGASKQQQRQTGTEAEEEQGGRALERRRLCGKEQQRGQNRRGAGANDEDGKRAHRRRAGIGAGLLFAVELVHRLLQPARRLQGVNVKERQRQSGKEQRHQYGNPRFLQDDLQVYLEDAEDGTEQSHRRPHRQHIDADEAVGAGAAGILADDEAGHDGHQRIDAGGEADANAEQQDERQGDEEIVV